MMLTDNRQDIFNFVRKKFERGYKRYVNTKDIINGPRMLLNRIKTTTSKADNAKLITIFVVLDHKGEFFSGSVSILCHFNIVSIQFFIHNEIGCADYSLA
jgi:hypothetical protein